MKLKGINAFEHYVDKAVLALVTLVALGVVGAQFFLQPNTITVGKDNVPLDRAYGPVEKAAEGLIVKVRVDKPELPPAPTVNILDRFKANLAGGVSPAREAAPMGPALALGAAIDGFATGAGSGPIAEVAVPAPGAVTVRQFGCTIDPLEVVAHPELKAILPKEQPFDKFAVSVETSFDGAALKEALQKDPDGAGPARAMPPAWYRESLEIVGVEMERQQLGSGGEWSDAKPVAPMPGRPDPLGDFKKFVKSLGDVQPLIDRVRARPDDAQRPDFYTMIAGPTWTPPTEASDGLTVSERIDAAQKKLNQVDEELRQANRQASRPKEPTRPPPSHESGPVGGGKGSSGNEAPSPRGQPPQGTRESNKPKQPTVLEKKIASLQAERDKLAKDLEELKAKQSGNAAAKATIDPTARPATLLENPKVRLWAHDVNVEPGATYRYHVRVVTNNPLFGKEAALTQQQKGLASQPMSMGAWSEWSEPVTVDRSTYYFVSSAQDRALGGAARASVELLQFYYGFYRHATVGLSPGDTIAGEAKLPKLSVFDMDKLSQGVRPSAPAAPTETAPGGGKGGAGQTGERGRPPPTLTGGNNKADIEKAAQEGSKPLADKLPINVDVVLVDVAAAPSEGTTSTKVVLRDAPGVIMTLVPEPAEKDPLLKRLLQAARLGENQGQPQVKPYEPKQDLPGPSERQPVPPRGRDGGGGGGGGGGG